MIPTEDGRAEERGDEVRAEVVPESAADRAWQAVQAAAVALADLPPEWRPKVQFGVSVPRAALDDIAARLGVAVGEQTHLNSPDGPCRIYSAWGALGLVQILGQGDRPATEAEIAAERAARAVTIPAADEDVTP